MKGKRIGGWEDRNIGESERKWYCYLPILLFSFILWAIPTFSQPPAYRYVVVDRLNNERLQPLFSLAQDQHGFLWMGYMYGLYKYDGVMAESFANNPTDATSITFGQVYSLTVSKKNGIWVGSRRGGLSCLDFNTQKATSFLHNPDDPKSLAGDIVTGILEDKQGNVWIGTDHFSLNLLRSGSRTFEVFRPPLLQLNPNASSNDLLGELVEDRYDPNLLWIGSPQGLYSFDKKSKQFCLYPFAEPMKYWYAPSTLQLATDTDGTIWVGGWDTGLMHFDPRTQQWLPKQEGVSIDTIANSFNTLNDIFVVDSVWVLALDGIGRIWWYNRTTNKLYIEKMSDLLGRGETIGLQRILRTADGDLWIAMNLGLVRLTKRQRAFPFKDFKKMNAEVTHNNWQRSTALSPDSTKLYIGTFRGDGLLIWDWKTDSLDVISYRKPTKPAESEVWMDALAFDTQGDLWIGSDEGLLFLKKNTRQIKSVSKVFPFAKVLANQHVSALLMHKNTLYVGTKGNGLFQLNLQSGQTTELSENIGIPMGATINKIIADRNGRIWVGHEKGLTCFSPSEGTFWRWGRQQGKALGLGHEHVWDIEFDKKGNLWIATLGGGLNFLKNGDPQNQEPTIYLNEESEGGGNVLYELEVAQDGRIWVGTDSGLSIFDPKDSIFTNYDHSDDLFAKIGSLAILPNQHVFSGANRGFHYFHPDTLLRHDAIPQVYLRSFRIFDEEVPITRHATTTPSFKLKYIQNHFSFELGALNFSENAGNRFAYRLMGADENWVYSGSRNYIGNNNLSPGKYQLWVKVANRHGMWSQQAELLNVIIRPPYWLQWWFLLIILILILSIVKILLSYWRQRQLVLGAQRMVDYFARSTYYRLASVEEIMWDVASNCISRLHFEDCVIYEVNEERQILIQKAAYGPKSPKPFEIAQPLEIPIGKGIVGTVAATGQPELIYNTRKDSRYIVDDERRHSEIAVPIVQEGKVIGVIDSEHSRKGYFTHYHLEILTTIASLCANKIAKAKAELAIRDKEQQLLELDKHLAEAQLTALRVQMNPHFLFNCLNSINWYIIKNKPREASKYLTKFSRLIRLILDHSKSQQITLAQELEALKLYIEMEAMRFERKFEFEIQVDETLDTDEIDLPPLIFQPYVENAIWHGLMQSTRPGFLKVALLPQNGHLLCIIEDNGIGRNAAGISNRESVLQHESKGMKITANRISMMRHQKTTEETVMSITDLYDEAGNAVGTRVELKLPMEK